MRTRALVSDYWRLCTKFNISISLCQQRLNLKANQRWWLVLFMGFRGTHPEVIAVAPFVGFKELLLRTFSRQRESHTVDLEPNKGSKQSETELQHFKKVWASSGSCRWDGKGSWVNTWMWWSRKVTHEASGEVVGGRKKKQRKNLFSCIPLTEQMNFIHLRIRGVADKHTQRPAWIQTPRSTASSITLRAAIM